MPGRIAMQKRMIRIFISSTFNDFETERDQLTEKVFPELESICQRYGVSFQVIDLRWGVSKMNALQNQSVQICFDEIDRCQKLSPRPNFIIMSGLRYGWRPLQTQITVEEWEMLTANLEKESTELKLLNEWYKQDENHFLRPFCLRARYDEELDDAYWEIKEKELASILFSLAEDNIGDDRIRGKFGLSATEQEIYKGLFDSEDAKEHTFVMIKNGYETDETEEMKNRARTLQKKIRHFIGEGRKNQICCYQDGEEIYLEKAKDFLTNIVNEQLRNITKLSDYQKEFQTQCEELKFIRQIYVQRPALEKKFNSFIQQHYGQAILIKGESGSGKSTFLKYWTERHFQHTVASFSDIQTGSRSILHALWFCVKSLEEKGILKGAESKPNYDNCINWLEEHLNNISVSDRIMLILDCVENTEDWTKITGSLFQLSIPSNVILIVSCISENSLNHRDVLCAPPAFNISDLSQEDAFDMLEKNLEKYERKISNPIQREKIIAGFSSGTTTPLYVSVVTEICKKLHSYQEDDLEIQFDIEDMIRVLFEKQANSMYYTLYMHTLGYLTQASDGLSEQEMIALLSRDKDVLYEIAAQTKWKFNSNFHIPIVLWARQYYAMMGFLMEIDSNGIKLMRFRHQLFYNIVKKMFPPSLLNQLAEAMVVYFRDQDLQYITDSGEIVVNSRKIRELYPLYERLNKKFEMRKLLQDPLYIDSFIRCGMYKDIIFQINDYRKHYGYNETDTDFLSLLYRNQVLFQSWPDCFMQSAVRAGLINKEVLIKTAKCWIEGAGIAEQKNGFYFPGISKSQFAVNDDRILAALQGGIIHIFDLNMHILTDASCNIGSDNGILYWNQGKLFFRGEYCRITLEYTNGELYLLKKEDCISWIELFNVQNRNFERAGGWIEYELMEKNENVFIYEDNGTYNMAELYYPPDKELSIYRKGILAAVIVDHTHIDILDVKHRIILGEYDCTVISGVSWAPSGREIIVVLENNYILTLSAHNKKIPVILPFVSDEKLKSYKIKRSLEIMIQTGIFMQSADLINHDGDRPLHNGPGTVDYMPQQVAFSVKKDFLACYYRNGNDSIVRLFRFSDRKLLIQSFVDPIFKSDTVYPAFYFQKEGTELVLVEEETAHILEIENLTWRTEMLKKDDSNSILNAIRKEAAERMSIWIPLDKKDINLVPKRKRFKDRVNDMTGHIFMNLPHRFVFKAGNRSISDSELMRQKLLHLPVHEQGEFLWLIDSAHGLIHVCDKQGKWICHDQLDFPIKAVDVDDNGVHILMENLCEFVTLKLKY